MSRIRNKIAVITGANSAVGLATAKAFIAEDVERLYLTGRSEPDDVVIKQVLTSLFYHRR